jgi:hypothetical protein
MGEPAAFPVRGGIYPYQGNIRRSDFLVISIDALNAAGTVLVAEVSETAPEDLRGLLAVQLGDGDACAGSWVLCWRLNYATASRFDVAGGHGRVSDGTLAAVVAGIRAVIEPL